MMPISGGIGGTLCSKQGVRAKHFLAFSARSNSIPSMLIQPIGPVSFSRRRDACLRLLVYLDRCADAQPDHAPIFATRGFVRDWTRHMRRPARTWATLSGPLGIRTGHWRGMTAHWLCGRTSEAPRTGRSSWRSLDASVRRLRRTSMRWASIPKVPRSYGILRCFSCCSVTSRPVGAGARRAGIFQRSRKAIRTYPPRCGSG
jgi:hypothetical protein